MMVMVMVMVVCLLKRVVLKYMNKVAHQTIMLLALDRGQSASYHFRDTSIPSRQLLSSLLYSTLTIYIFLSLSLSLCLFLGASLLLY